MHQCHQIMDRNLLPKCPITHANVDAAEDIFGPDMGCLKGKAVQHAIPHALTRLLPGPLPIMRQYYNVTLAGDIFQMNCIPFFMTISHNIHFCTTKMVTNQRASTLLKSIKQVWACYASHSFCVLNIVLDRKLKSLHSDLANINIGLETCGHDNHVPETERQVQAIKECTLAYYNTLPFQHMPAYMLIELIHHCTILAKCIPTC
jgi:hypothetical protein